MKRADILDTAKKCVCGERETDYGKPENNFQVIADLWSAYYGKTFSSLDVAMMMSLLKIARIKSGTATEDSFIDAAGYIACGGEIADNTMLIQIDIPEPVPLHLEEKKEHDIKRSSGRYSWGSRDDPSNLLTVTPEMIFYDFKESYPEFINDIDDYKACDPYSIIVTTNNNGSILYNWVTKKGTRVI